MPSHVLELAQKELRALKGYFGPQWGQKVKFALHQILLISLFEQWPKSISLISVLLLPLLW